MELTLNDNNVSTQEEQTWRVITSTLMRLLLYGGVASVAETAASTTYTVAKALVSLTVYVLSWPFSGTASKESGAVTKSRD